MTDPMPLSLIISWVTFFSFLFTHIEKSGDFRQGEWHKAIQSSALLGILVGISLLGYYFTQVNWYWPIILIIVGYAVVFFGQILLGDLFTSLYFIMLAFIGWPAAAIWTFFIIRGLHP